MPSDHRPLAPERRPPFRSAAALALALAVPLLATGCQTGPFAAWRTATDNSLSKAPTREELGDENRSFFARWFAPGEAASYDPAKRVPLVKGLNGMEIPKEAANPEAETDHKAAYALFEKKDYAGAVKAFETIAKKRAKTSWGEKAQFYVGECYYLQKKLVWANDAYEKLFADYPGSVFVEKLVSREYEIAKIWLATAENELKPEQQVSWQGRFDGRRPIMDTWGYAKAAFEHVRAHDPSGPLADDATMALGDMHMKARDYELAAIYYDQFITEYPKSPFLQKAYLAEIDAHLKNYLGPEYDGSGLEKARERIKQTMTLFPDPSGNNEKLYHLLDIINDAEAERTFKAGEFYRRTGKIASAEHYFGKIPQRWPKSPWAVKAKTELATLAKMPRTPSLPSRILTSPGTTDPFSMANGNMGMGMGGGGPMGAMGGMGGMGGMGMGPMGGMGMM